jgi:hypothetical protein
MSARRHRPEDSIQRAATAEPVSGDQTPTPKQLAEAHDRARQLGLTIRGRKNFVLDDGKEREPCGDFSRLMFKIAWREAVERGEPTLTLSACGSHGFESMNDKDNTEFYVERQEDDSYKRIAGSKVDLETGETIQFDILEDGTQQETRRLRKRDDNEDEGEITNAADEKADDELTALASRINDEHQAATSALREGVLHAIAAGESLLKAKAQLNHGGWLDWLKANCEIPERTVQAYMRLARLPVEKRNAVADLPLREALSAIRSRQERLERTQEAENRPPPGAARVCTVGPSGEALAGEDATADASAVDGPRIDRAHRKKKDKQDQGSSHVRNIANGDKPRKDFDPDDPTIPPEDFPAQQFLFAAAGVKETGNDATSHIRKFHFTGALLDEALEITESIIEQWSDIRSLLLNWSNLS